MEISNYSNLIYQYDSDITPQDDIPLYVTIVFVILGTTGNLLVCLAVILHKSLQTLTKLVLCSLAFTDLLISLMVLPARRIMNFTALNPSEFYWCILFVSTDDFLTAASAIHICLISVERYLVIKDPMYVTKMSKGRTIKRILVVWLTSLLSIIPVVVIALMSDNYPSKSSYCNEILASMSFYEGLLISEALIIIIMVIVVCYSFIGTVTILYELTKKQKEQKDGNSGMIRSVGGTNKKNQLKSLNNEMKAVRVVWIVSFAFIVAMGPYMAVNLCFLINDRIVIPSMIITLSSYLNYSNSVINPILYTFFNKQFRESFWNILTCRLKKV